MVKIKEIRVTANYAWSPKTSHPIYVAAGTAAQQLDATFSSNASLELYAVDITDPTIVAKCAGKVDVSDRFHKVVWGSSYSDSTQANGVIVCGTDKGGIEIYDPDKILSSEKECLVLSTSKHTGPVRALDFNAFQKNLFASGANDSEIFIWDLKNPGNPMTPGKKSQPLAAISSIAWNKQVQHILASTSTLNSGPCCVVWDLRRNEPVIKVQDPSGRMQCSDAAWHPEIATQLVLASEDDHAPVVQLWDLRFATSPMKVLEKHQCGVVSLSWCPRDPDLLLTCGKDNKVYCWNPNTSPPEVVSELETHAQWCFDVQWCPRNPNVVSAGSFDGHISIHSLMGGGDVADETESVDQAQRNAVAEAFGSESFTNQQQNATAPKRKTSTALKKPPKWMRRPCGATFFFGGKLVTFQNVVSDESQQKHHVHRNVDITQVITESNLVERSTRLREALLNSSQCFEYCQKKISDAKNEFEEDFWNFVKVNFDSEPRQQYLQLLGYNASDLKSKFEAFTGTKPVNGNLEAEVENLSVAGKGEPCDGRLSHNSSSNALDAFDQIAAASEATTSIKRESPAVMIIPTGDNDAASGCQLSVDGEPSTNNIRRRSTLACLPEDLDSLISQALLVGDYESAVDLCLHGGRMADAIVIASAGGATLLEKTQKRYFASSNLKMLHRLLSAVITKDWNDIVSSCDLNNWKEALASLLTYASSNDLVHYCDMLGDRLEGDERLRIRACLCYVCSGNIDKFVRCWDKIQSSTEGRNAEVMQDLVEKMMVLLHIVEKRRQNSPLGEKASDKLARYASTLAAQGQLAAAMEILPVSCEKQSVLVLRDRLFHSQGDVTAGKQPPAFPFNREGLQNRPSAQVQPQQYQQQPARKPFQQPSYNQPVSPVQPQVQQRPYYSDGSAPQRSQPDAARRTYPYANPALQRPSQPAPAVAPASIFTPQTQPLAPAPTPMQPSVFVHQRHTRNFAQEVRPHLSNLKCKPSFPTSTYQPANSVPASNGPAFMQPQPQADLSPPPAASDLYGDGARHHKAGGWNDPPMLDPNRVPKHKKTVRKPIQAENLNIMTPTQPAQTPPDPYLPSAMRPAPSVASGMMQPAPMHPAPMHLAPMHPSGAQQGPMLGVVNQRQNAPPLNNVMQQPQLPAQPTILSEESDDLSFDWDEEPTSTAPSVPTAAPKDVPKAPIPAEHQVLQAQFGGLVEKCIAQATNAQMKRKLDECSRRLEFLYDKLRAGTPCVESEGDTQKVMILPSNEETPNVGPLYQLSPNIVKGLHQIANSIGSRDYPTGLRHHTQIVSSSNFSEISAFMPGLKMLLQIASQLRI